MKDRNMDIDYSKVSAGIATRLAAATMEAEQWKNVAETLSGQNSELTSEIDALKAKLEAATPPSEETAVK